MGNRFRMVVNEVDAVPTDAPLPKLPVARALWVPQPDLQDGRRGLDPAPAARTTPASATP